MTTIFVYGTLKRGFCRQAAIADQEFLGAGKTTADYLLFDLGDYPGLVAANEASGQEIHGEVYRVDADCLQRLDLIECVEQNLYRRGAIQLQDPWNKQPVVSYFYLLPTDQYDSINDWQ